MKVQAKKESRRPGQVRSSAWVDDIRSGKTKMIPGEQVLRELSEEFPDEK